jgi:amino acid permease
MYPTLTDTSLLLNPEFWVTVAILLVLPFAFAKRLDSLRYTSALALCAVVYLLFIVSFYFISPDAAMPPRPSFEDIRWIRIDSSFLNTVPIFVFAFTCHQNVKFSLYFNLFFIKTQIV